LPHASFTATLQPTLRPDGGLTLASQSDSGQTGHYLTSVDPDSGELTTVAVHGFAERLEVYVDEGELRAEHAFAIFGLDFLMLRYRMHRRSS
jgi:hypothetical protein